MLQIELGLPIADGGFMTHDSGRYGCSPDWIIAVGNRRELVEIKCPESIPRHVCNLLFGLGEHKAQVQGQLLISGFNAVHFYSYHESCPPYYAKVERDEAFISQLQVILDNFCSGLDLDEQRARKMGHWNT